MKSILFTQCLQNDFVAPLGPWDPLPCLLHVGSAEASRLCGEVPAEGPLARFLDWSHRQSQDVLEIVHIRDAHDPKDPEQAEHLAHFGPHCLEGTPGAEFAFPPPPPGRTHSVRSRLLNDFIGTDLEAVLGRILPGASRVGIVGAWTDAKVSFLAYELRTRHPHLEIGVCSALSASSSRDRHLLALDHLERIMGVRLFHSLGEFMQFLSPEDSGSDLLEGRRSFEASTVVECDVELSPTDRRLLSWLFRGSAKARARALSGGFSGNVVLAVESADREGVRQCPHVVKIGESRSIGRERISFESIESILGNSAPRVADFADLDGRGALKYRYASMTGGGSRTFQSLWKNGLPLAEVEEVLRTVFSEQLGRLYQASSAEAVDLLTLWGFEEKWAEGVERNVRDLGVTEPTRPFSPIPGVEIPPVVPFYREVVPRHLGRRRELAPIARVHGDLNGANILLDDHRNVWLIDFFHTARHHVACDFVKLESDLLHVWTPLSEPGHLGPFGKMLERLLQVRDLAEALPDSVEAGIDPLFSRTWETIRILRSILGDAVGVYRDPWHHHIAALRYAVHTLGFEECDHLQRQGALLHAGMLASWCSRRLGEDAALRVDWIPLPGVPGRLGLTILPGRQDRGRNLGDDVERLRETGATTVVTLVTDQELSDYGVSGLGAALEKAGIGQVRLPVPDQKAASLDEGGRLSSEILSRCRSGETVVVHCVGGIGRSGMVAALVAVQTGLEADAAIALVRRHRSPRALETPVQERLVRDLEETRRA